MLLLQVCAAAGLRQACAGTLSLCQDVSDNVFIKMIASSKAVRPS